MEHLRVFVAVTPDETILDKVEAKVADLKGEILMREIRWEPRSKWHVTLRFLGDVSSSEISALSSSLRANCSGHPVFDGQVQGLGAFPSLRRPRILWAGVLSTGQEFSSLHAAVSKACAPFIPDEDDKPFRPHLTIARIRNEQRKISSRISEAVEAFGTMPFGSWEVRNVELWRSILQPGGSRYELLERIGLAE